VINIYCKNPATATAEHLVDTITLAGGTASTSLDDLRHYKLSDTEHSSPTTPTVVYTASGQPTAGETFTLNNGIVLTFRTTVVNSNDVLIGSAFDDTYTNLQDKINALRTNVRAAYNTGANTLTLTPGDVEYPAGAGTYIASGWDDTSLVAWTGGFSHTATNLTVATVTAGVGSQHTLYVEFETPGVAMNLKAELEAESEEHGAV